MGQLSWIVVVFSALCFASLFSSFFSIHISLWLCIWVFTASFSITSTPLIISYTSLFPKPHFHLDHISFVVSINPFVIFSCVSGGWLYTRVHSRVEKFLVFFIHFLTGARFISRFHFLRFGICYRWILSRCLTFTFMSEWTLPITLGLWFGWLD